MDDAWQRFGYWARRRDQLGKQLLIPILGAGFNTQADRKMNWADLLEAVRSSAKIGLELPPPEALVGNSTLAWESLVMWTAVSRQQRPHEAEDWLLDKLCEQLRAYYTPTRRSRAFVSAFLALGFTDVISFNFDAVLLSALEPTWTHPSDGFCPLGSHARVGATRIWYPHGFVAHEQSIHLGMRKYGIFIEQLEVARARYKARESELKAALYPDKLEHEPSTDEQRERLWSAHREQPESWLAVAMNAPLVFIGMSLGREEWPLWWFLNQRARNHARRRIERPTFVFMKRDEAERLRVAADLAGITLLTFDDFASGWERLLSSLR